jgi:hypothetical protein
MSKLERVKDDRVQAAFGPRSFHIARLLITSRAPTFIALLDEVGTVWPDLSYADFYGGYVLSDLLVRYPGEIRAAEGLPPPGGDPVEWLDRVIALTSPARGRA